MAPSRVKSTSHRRLRSALPSIGPFENLPSDCFHVILKWIPLEDIGNLGITSRRMRSLVWNWAQSSSCLNRGSLFLMPFSLLCKRITMLLSTKERVDFMVDIFHKCLIQSHSERGIKTEEEKEFSSPWNIPCNEKFVNYFLNYGQMLFTFTRGWAEGEYSILLPALDEFFAISDRLTKYLGYIFNSPRDFFNKENGIVDFEIQTVEKELKLVIRALWWDLTQSEFSFRV
ncbi:Fbox protein 47 [Caligus rogercresseyi]|uniref:Fbox protein 47 n=1 Tax=Caligus rogercresseyi TaxID=217165 RepID=A0A7T8QUY7_CALRO|nr:Fbox protein 47 [Caligus rogercresseyi]